MKNQTVKEPKNIETPTILVCVDSSNACKMTLRYACYKARKRGFAVQILSIMDNSYKNLLFASKAIGKEKRSNLEKHLSNLIDDMNKEIGIIPSISIREGEIAEQIIKEIKETPSCTMLILGKSQNSLSDNTVLPNISRQIGGKIKVPVVIVPENIGEDYLQNLV